VKIIVFALIPSILSVGIIPDTHKLIVGQHLGVLDAIESGQAKRPGDINELVNFLNLFDNLAVSTNGNG